ncbi:MAG: hypothetical protein J5747_07915 [Spirochaetaceae bacterium]|nr:hypothetical protein [Spirochaetaceae bacterium]
MRYLSFSQIFLLFLSYSLIGWFSEVIYCSSIQKRFINRGFLKGPICPVYGFGGLLVMSILEPLSSTWIPLFFLSMLVTSALEYVTSWILEKLFDTKWWDYSHYKFNIKGRVCLLNSTLFGLMGMLASHFVQPLLIKLVTWIQEPLITYIAIGLAIILSVDFIFTVRKLVNFSTYLAKLEEFSETLKTYFVKEAWFNSSLSFDEILKSLKEQTKQKSDEVTANIMKRIESFKNAQKKTISFINNFPTMTSKRYKSQLEQLRKLLKH